MELITTPQAAELLGVTPSTVKRWAAEGRLPCLLTPGGHRRFRSGDIARFLKASGGRTDDLALRLVEQLLHEPEPHALQALLMTARGRLGSWWAVADLLGTVLEAIGRQWQDGRCSVSQEHRASHCLEGSLSACLASLPAGDPERRCLLVAVEDDIHTLGLSLAELCVGEAGWTALWLGTPTPTSEFSDAVKLMRPEVVAVSASAWSSDIRVMESHYRRIAAACRPIGAQLILGGRGAWPKKPAYGRRVDDFEAFSKALRRHRAAPHAARKRESE